MTESVFSEENLYEAADVGFKTVPIDQIRYVGVSVQQYRDISIIAQASRLEIATFRLCGFSSFPMDFFSLKYIQCIDLSGNQIQTLPNEENWARMCKLRLLNLSDNSISNLNEVFKMKQIPFLKQLNLTGNICLSAQDSFNRIVREFPTLLVLNDLIITSQHRGFLMNVANFDPTSTLPLSKTDDFFFLYVKYMHTGSNERYVRRTNAEFFCLNRAIRKYSSIEKIQSIFRGYIVRTEYQKTHNAAIFLKAIISKWYKKRYQAALVIKRCFLYHLTRQKVRLIRAVRLIQSTWRKRLSRKESLFEIFQTNNGYFEFFLTPNSYTQLISFLSSNGYPFPDSRYEGEYKLIKFAEPSHLKFPGSPFIYYSLNSTLIIRKIHSNKFPPNVSLWCGHDHSKTSCVKRATNNGVNWTIKCRFASVKPFPYMHKIRNTKLMNYPSLIRVVYETKDAFSSVIMPLVENHPQGMHIIPTKVVEWTAAQISTQSAMRSFLVRSKLFRNMKQEVLETRASTIIRYWLKTMQIHKNVVYISGINKYFMALPDTATYYIPNLTFQRLHNMNPKHKVEFGYTTEKSLVLSKSVVGYLPEVIQQGRIMFAIKDLSSLLKMGTTISKASPSSFPNITQPKWVKKYHILKVSFATPLEAKRRLLLLGWMTGDFSIVLTDQAVIEYCAANAIKSVWVGLTSRRMLRHLYAQTGQVMMLNRLSKKAHLKQRKLISKNIGSVMVKKHVNISPEEAISKLRGDYKPWVGILDDYKIEKPYVALEPSDLYDGEAKPSIDSTINVDMSIDVKKINKKWKSLDKPSVVIDIPKTSLRQIYKKTEMNNKNVHHHKGKNAMCLDLQEMIIRKPESIKSQEFLIHPYSSQIQIRSLKRTRSEIIILHKLYPYLPIKDVLHTSRELPFLNDKKTISGIIKHNTRITSKVSSTPITERKNIRNGPSAQITDSTNITRVREAFITLVRLHQIGEEIQQEAIVDNTLEEKRIQAKKTRESISVSRQAANITKEVVCSDTIERNVIEKTELCDMISISKEQSHIRKSKMVQKIKEETKAKQQKRDESKRFGHMFVSCSRIIAQQTESHRRIEQENKLKSITLQTTSETCKAEKEARHLSKERMNYMQSQKIRISRLDKVITEYKRQKMKDEGMQKINTIYEEKRKDKERRILSKSDIIPKISKIIPIVKLDEIEEAIQRIYEHIGKNIGITESQILVDLINKYV